MPGNKEKGFAIDVDRLKDVVRSYAREVEADREAYEKDLADRRERKAYYQSWTKDRIALVTEEEFHDYLSRLWAMRIWGNKEYAIGKIIEGNGFPAVRKHLAALLWGEGPVESRWDAFRSSVKGIGPATMSELLCHTHPEECLLWNRRAYVAFQKLGVPGLPRYDYQLDGKKYRVLSDVALAISTELKKQGLPDTDLLARCDLRRTGSFRWPTGGDAWTSAGVRASQWLDTCVMDRGSTEGKKGKGGGRRSVRRLAVSLPL